MRRAILGILGVAILIGGGQGAASQQRPPIPEPDTETMSRVLNAYAAGDDTAVEQWLATPQRWTTDALRDFEAVVRRKDLPRRMRLAFALETIIAGRSPFVSYRLLDIGRRLVAVDARPLGVDADEDRFEILWHETAIAAAQTTGDFRSQLRYLDEVAPRYEDARKRGVNVTTRFLLARGVATLGMCCRDQQPGPNAMVIVNSRPPAPVNNDPLSVDGALLFFRQAAAIPALEVEALIRAGVALHGAGRHDAALQFLDRVPAHDDMMLGYVQHLTRGHILDERDRPAAAAAAYRRALEFMPTPQGAAIGLAAALLRSGDAEAAAAAAIAAKRLPRLSYGVDPRVRFRHADARFLPLWLAEIRKLRR